MIREPLNSGKSYLSKRAARRLNQAYRQIDERCLSRLYKILYFWRMKQHHKPIEFCGSSLNDLRTFPEDARREAGYQLDQVQQGLEPDDWKPMPGIGAGVREIRIREVSGAFRIIYLAKLEDAIFVLHCFQKKTQKTSRVDLVLATQRLKDLIKELGP